MEPIFFKDEALNTHKNTQEVLESDDAPSSLTVDDWTERVRKLSDSMYAAEEAILADPKAATWKQIFQYASILSEIYNITGQVEYLSTSIQMSELAGTRMFDASSRERATVLSHRGLCLGQRYNHDSTEFEQSLNLGIEALTSAIEELSPMRDVDTLEGLRILLRKRFSILPTDEDIRMILKLAEEVLVCTSPDEVVWTTRFKAWGSAVVMWLLREQQIGAVDTTPVVQKALETIQGDWRFMDRGSAEHRPERREVFLNILVKVTAFGLINQQNAAANSGTSLDSPNESFSMPLSERLNSAEELIRQEEDNTDQSEYLKLLLDVAELPNKDSIHSSIEIFKKHTKKGSDYGHLNSMVLGLLFKDRFELNGDNEALNTSMALLKTVVESQDCPVLQRIDAARSYAVLLQKVQELSTAHDVLRAAVELLPQLSTRSMRRENQERNLSIVSGLAEEACAATLEAGITTFEAVRILEKASGLIMGFVIDRRTELAPSPSLLEFNGIDELEAAQDELNRISSSAPDPAIEKSNQRETAWSKYAAIVEKIRNHGHPGFLMPPSNERMSKFAEGGPIVIFNCHKLRCDAIIISRKRVNHIRLLKLEYAELEERMETLAKGIIKGSSRTYRFRCQLLISLLNWLWDCVVEPVWEALRTEVDSELDPRIWWIRTGPLSLAPIHAAGTFSERAKNAGFERVISSYAPTLKALEYARSKARSAFTGTKKRFVAISMPTTPGKRPLDNAESEISSIDKILEAQGWDCRKISQPCADDVLHHLIDGPTILHCACHAISNFHQPSESALLFVKQAPTPEQTGQSLGQGSAAAVPEAKVLDPLTISKLSNIWLRKPAFVMYISACSTAGSLNPRLSSQAVHIGGEFLLIGFPHIIGTMWKAQDEACSRIAVQFYKNLSSIPEVGWDSRAVAAALHSAISQLRQTSPEDVLAWLPFVHYGA